MMEKGKKVQDQKDDKGTRKYNTFNMQSLQCQYQINTEQGPYFQIKSRFTGKKLTKESNLVVHALLVKKDMLEGKTFLHIHINQKEKYK